MTDTLWLVQTGDSDVISGLLYISLAWVRPLAWSCGTFNAEMKSRATLYFLYSWSKWGEQKLCSISICICYMYSSICCAVDPRVCTGCFILKSKIRSTVPFPCLTSWLALSATCSLTWLVWSFFNPGVCTELETESIFDLTFHGDLNSWRRARVTSDKTVMLFVFVFLPFSQQN